MVDGYPQDRHLVLRAVLMVLWQREDRSQPVVLHSDLFVPAGLHLHDLRQEGTSRFASLFAIHELTKITGHSDAKILLRYHPLATDLAVRFL